MYLREVFHVNYQIFNDFFQDERKNINISLYNGSDVFISNHEDVDFPEWKEVSEMNPSEMKD